MTLHRGRRLVRALRALHGVRWQAQASWWLGDPGRQCTGWRALPSTARLTTRQVAFTEAAYSKPVTKKALPLNYSFARPRSLGISTTPYPPSNRFLRGRRTAAVSKSSSISLTSVPVIGPTSPSSGCSSTAPRIFTRPSRAGYTAYTLSWTNTTGTVDTVLL